MDRKKISVRGVEEEAVSILHQLRQIEQRMTGVIITDCILEYWRRNYESE